MRCRQRGFRVFLFHKKKMVAGAGTSDIICCEADKNGECFFKFLQSAGSRSESESSFTSLFVSGATGCSTGLDKIMAVAPS